VLKEELYTELLPTVRALERQEQNTIQPDYLYTWNGAKLANGGRIDSKLGGN
ncbi:MAG: hypothetical protein HeimAB125_14430, partial [Candidatus Heimdallarchaeota archaeon AB_125]